MAQCVMVVRVPWWVRPMAYIWARFLWLAHVTCPSCVDLDAEVERFSGFIARRCVVLVKDKVAARDA